MYKVSVIVPVYNAETKLCRCVSSLVNQTLNQIEIILVNDGSTDSSKDICMEYAERFPFIKVINKENEGLGYTRNAGLEVAEGEYVCFVDSDDYLELSTLQSAYERAKEYSADYVRYDIWREYEDGKPCKKNRKSPLEEGFYNREKIRNKILLPLFGQLPYEGAGHYVDWSSCIGLYKLSVIKNYEIKFLSERDIVSEDLIFNIQFMQAIDSAFVIDKRFYHYIQNDGSLTHSYREDRFEKCLKLYSALLDLLKKTGYFEVGRLRVNRTLLVLLRNCIRYELLNNPDKKKISENIKGFLENQTIKDLFVSYPIKQMPLKYKVAYTGIKHRNMLFLKAFKKKI